MNPQLTEAQIIEAAIKAKLSENLGANLGGLMLGYALDVFLLGVMMVQLSNYFRETQSDRLFIRIIVMFVCTIAFATTIFSTYIIWRDFIIGHGTFSQFVDAKYVSYWSLTDTLTTIPVQVFYLDRAVKLSNKRWIAIPAILGMIAEFIGSISIIVVISQVKGLAANDPTKPFTYLWSAATLFTDILLTVVIIKGLANSKTGWSSTDSTLNRLIKISLESALPPLITAVGFLLTYIIVGTSNLFLLFWEASKPKIYVVVLLAVLNSRSSLNKEWSSRGGTEGRSNNYGFGTGVLSRNQQNTIKLDGIHVDVAREQQASYAAPFSTSENRRPFGDESTAEPQDLYYDGGSRTALNEFPTTKKSDFV